MVATNLKAQTMSLIDKRDATEIEMNIIIERLCQPGGPGISGSLGFPRSDIDISTVRAERHRLSGIMFVIFLFSFNCNGFELRNDYKDITEKINENLEVLHSGRLARNVSSAVKDSANGEGSNNQVSFSINAVASASSRDVLPEDTPSSMDVDVIISEPFAMVDEIADASPAAEDGLQLGDQIVKFGNVESGGDLLPRLASEAQSNQGRPLPLVVMRQGALINLTVTPRPWHGRGLLGYA
ncbi:hypothetical protein HHK36_006390 [Tetracentron sinense]|uniref:PDZ domain-containing protein n=1 Tax=Tetracentron sinense TaxID=13715 RepID=A0A835DKT8_TETSI|nr:hypothetical protein HHK36_006390 [Tetracentron sinense]